MEELAVSELQQITVEIKVLKQQTAQNIIEIGKRLKDVKNQLEHGQYLEWLSGEVDFDNSTASKFIKVADQFSNVATSPSLSTGKLFELIALPESVDRQDFIEQPHTVPSTGETKTVDEMTVRELREVKQSLFEAKRRAEIAEKKASEAIEQAQSLIERDRLIMEENERLKREKNPEPKVEYVEVPPADYEDAIRKNQEMNTRIARLSGDMESIKREYESRLRDVQDGDVKAHKRELTRLLSAQLEALNWNHSSALFVFQQLQGNPEAVRAVREFMNEYQERCRKQLSDWQSAITLNHEEETTWKTV